MLHQRRNDNAPLDQALAQLKLHFPNNVLPDCKKARDESISSNTGDHSIARNPLSKDLYEYVAKHSYESLLSTHRPTRGNQRAFLLDGTTTSLAVVEELPKAYPPATNQHTASPWPLTKIVTGFELSTGLALVPQTGPKKCPQATSELVSGEKLLGQLPAHSIVIADRNFGVFKLAHEANQAGHDVVLRLTAKRVGALIRKASPIEPGLWQLN